MGKATTKCKKVGGRQGHIIDWKHAIELLKQHIPTTYKELIERQVLNGDKLLEKHLSKGLSNDQYKSRFSARVLIEAIDIWIKRKLTCVSKGVPTLPSQQMSARTSVLRKMADGGTTPETTEI